VVAEETLVDLVALDQRDDRRQLGIRPGQGNGRQHDPSSKHGQRRSRRPQPRKNDCVESPPEDQPDGQAWRSAQGYDGSHVMHSKHRMRASRKHHAFGDQRAERDRAQQLEELVDD